MKNRLLFPLIAASILTFAAAAAHAAHTAYVFNTDGNPLPAELITRINTRGGAGTQIIEIRPGEPAAINGVPVRSVGVVNLPRFDNTSLPAPVAYHYLVAGDLNLAADQSIWGWGSRLLKLEVANNASFAAGSFVTVEAVGRLGGAGGGNGGIPAPNPFPTLTNASLGLGGLPGLGGGTQGVGLNGGTGTIGGLTVAFIPGVGIVPPSTYASSVSGGDGGMGQGEAEPSPGGQGAPYTGPLPTGGTPGQGGPAGGNDIFGIPADGLPGWPGWPGGPGAAGVFGAVGQLRTLAGSAVHLRAGSGGGAGATGGRGIVGATGGGGGGGGTSGEYFGSRLAGGDGGFGQPGGLGGTPGIGGAGGGGGGGIQLLVRGVFFNAAAFQSSGGHFAVGLAGGAGAAGSPEVPGNPGQAFLALHGGSGGNGGRGGDGGLGGLGGFGASGAGGNIQIVASAYFDFGAIFNTAGGAGALAGLAQIHDFMGAAQHAPFGFFSARPNPFRSYRGPVIVTGQQAKRAVDTPLLPGLQGGAAPYGLLSLSNFSSLVATQLSPAAGTAGMVLRLDPIDNFSLDLRTYTGYDLLVFTSVQDGRSIESPALCAINPDDVAVANQPFPIELAVIPDGPQPLIFNAGYLHDPAIFPGASGPVTGSPIPYGTGYALLVEKDKVFDVTASFSPYGTPRVFTGTPVVGTLSGNGPLPQGAIQLKDRGWLGLAVSANTPFETGTLAATMSETSQTLEGSMFVRVGSTTSGIRYEAEQFGHPGTLASGTYDLVRSLPNGDSIVSFPSYSGVAAEQIAFSGTLPVASAGWPLGTSNRVVSLVLRPNYDDQPHAIAVNVTGKFVGPQVAFNGLTEDTGVRRFDMGTLSLGQEPVNGTFRIFNWSASVPPDWTPFLSANPQLRRLSVLGMEIAGPGASAFSLQSASTFELNPTVFVEAGAVVTVRFAPPGPGTYTATLRILTDENADYGQPGDTHEIQLQATALPDNFATWALDLPPGLNGPGDDADGDGVINFHEFATRNTPAPFLSGSGFHFEIPSSERASLRWTVEGSTNLTAWELLAARIALGPWEKSDPDVIVLETLSGPGGNRRVEFSHTLGSRDRYFFRLLLEEPPFLEYLNDFSTEARAALRGSAVLDGGSLRLTDSIGGQAGAAVLDGVKISPNQSGFDAAFTLITGPTTTGTPADGISFAVGDLGTAAWGENGPATARNLSIAFDTFGSGAQITAKGIRIMVNGALVAYNATDPYTDGVAVPVEVSFDYTTGVTVRFNGNTIFANVQVPGFVMQPGDRFGFGARTGSFAQENRVDDVSILPH